MGTKKLTAIPTVSLCGPDVAYATVWPRRSDIRNVSHFVAKHLGHTSAYATVWPGGSDINIFAHFVTQILGHTSAYATVWPRRSD